MKQSSELVLTFLLNAIWLIALITAAASLASLLLRGLSARYRHAAWVSALMLAFFIPLIVVTTQAFLPVSTIETQPSTNLSVESAVRADVPSELSQFDGPPRTSSFQLNRTVALVLIIGYFVLIAYRVFRFLQAWRSSIQIRRGAEEIIGDDRVRRVISGCEEALAPLSRKVVVLSSSSIYVPVTSGFFRPVIILPDRLLLEGNVELLTSAIGHEYIHVRRRDYVFNLLYEVLYIPLSFHPAAAFIRRCIKQTRELCCDELVAQRIIKPDAYARSLVKLAGSAPTLRRLSVTTTVGIADADILETRIMSLLKKPRMDARWKTVALIVVSLLLVVPCVASAAIAVRFELQPSAGSFVQEPVTEIQETKERGQEKEKLKMEVDSLRRRLEVAVEEPLPQEQEKAKLRELEIARIKRAIEVLQGRLAEQSEEVERGYAFNAELKDRIHREEELKAERLMQMALVRLARVQMDQAIQIATTAHPGKVLSCTLNAEGWEEPGKLSPEGRLFYRVVVLSGDESKSVYTHVLVDAVDGSIIRSEKEFPRKMRRTEEP